MSNSTNFFFLDSSENPLNQFIWGGYDSKTLSERFFNNISDENRNVQVITETEEENVKWSTIVDFHYKENDHPAYSGKFAFTLKIFISKDGDKVIDSFKKTEGEVKEDEVLLFLEDNEGDTQTKAIYRSRVGRKVQVNLYDKIHLLRNQKIVDSLPQGADIDVDLLEKILRGDNLDGYAYMTAADFAGKVIYGMNVFGHIVSKGGVWLLEKVITFVKGFKATEEFWLPSKKKEGAVTSFIQEAIKEKLDDSESSLDDLMEVIKDEFENFDSIIKAFLQRDFGRVSKIPFGIGALSGIELPGIELDFVPSNVEELIRKYYAQVSDIIKNLLDRDSEAIIEFAKGFMTVGLDAGIAFYTGVYNALIDAVAGILTLVKWAFQAIDEAGEFLKDVENSYPKLMELIERAIQGLKNFSFSSMLEGAKAGIIKLWGKLKGNFSADLNDVMARIAYFAGNIVGFLLELLIEALLTGGTASVVALFNKFGKIGAIIKEVAQKVLNLSAKKAAKNFLDTLQSFVDFLNKSGAKLREFTEGVFEAIGRWWDELSGVTKSFSKVLLAFFDDLGLALVPLRLREGLDGRKYLVFHKQNKIFEGTEEAIIKFADDLRKVGSERRQYLNELAGTSNGVYNLGGKRITYRKEILDFLNARNLKIVRKPKGKKSLDIVDEDGVTIFRALPENIEKYYEFFSKTSEERIALVNSMKERLTTSPKVYDPKRDKSKDLNIPKSSNGTSPDLNGMTEHLFRNQIEAGRIRIKVTGSRDMDFEQAYKKLGISKKDKGKYTWHHLDDLDENLECTMQLVKTSIHNKLFPHIGSAKQFTELLNIEYLT